MNSFIALLAVSAPRVMLSITDEAARGAVVFRTYPFDPGGVAVNLAAVRAPTSIGGGKASDLCPSFQQLVHAFLVSR